MTFSIAQGQNDSAQGGEALVDLLGLLQDLALGLGLGDSFGASQVDEIQLGRLDGAVLVELLVL